jgi:2-polyprenyl-3-methyl-5-hydroxy-6-metoxy-1,4-benzoquinol methylase
VTPTAAACPVCRSTWRRTVEQAEPPYRVLRCSACGLAYVDPIPDPAVLARHYDSDYYAEWLARQSVRRERMWTRRLKLIARMAAKGSILDVGCGEGGFLEVAHRAGWRIYGTDVSAYAVEFASRRLGQKMFCGEIWDAGFPAQRFDVITLWHVLEHTAFPVATLQKIRCLLKPEGLLVLAVPNLDDRLMQVAYRLVKRRHAHLFSIHDKEIHLLHFSVQSLRFLLEKTGFARLMIGPDFGVVELSKRLINHAAAGLFRLTGVHWYNSIQVVARRG